MKIHSDLPVFSQLRTPGQSALRTPGKFFSCKKSFPDTRSRVRVSGTGSAKCLSPVAMSVYPTLKYDFHDYAMGKTLKKKTSFENR